MFVSLLQLMGLPLGKPVHSRASSNQRSQRSKAQDEGSDIDVKVQGYPARRQEVKAKTGKVKVVAKAPVNAKPKSAVKPAVKAKVKTPAKSKPVSKPVAKPAPKSAATKAARKPKSLPKAAPKVPKRGAAKVAKRVPKVKAQVVSTTAVKAVKPAANVKTKDSVNTTIDKTTKPQAVKVKSPPAAVAKPAAVAPVPAPTSAPPVPARAGRPSSRLAQLTVPSMAQSVASTAAKASFTQTLASPLIVPPLASAIKKDPKLANNWKSKSVEQLSDAELIAMPDDEYMNEFQMTFFRRRLVQLKKDILSNAGETTEHLREDTVVVPDPADRATIEEEHALELRTRDRERKLLKKIEQSIARIDAGDYGYCDETGEPIGVGRLLARPTANLSLEAQQRRELKQKMFGD